MALADFIQFKRDIAPMAPDVITTIGPIPIANSTFFMLLVIAIVCVVTFLLYRNKNSEIPTRLQSFVEILYEAVENQINTITASAWHTNRILPLIGSVFLFVGISNYLGMIPGIGSITFDGVTLFRTATGDFNTTFGLAMGAIIVLQGVSIRDFGLWGHINKYIPFQQMRQDLKKGVLGPVYAFVTLLIAGLDIVGEFSKALSASLRLFGNLYAGDVLTTILLGLTAFVLPSFWVAFGLLGSIVQTIVFGSLITIYYMQAAGPEPENKEKTA